MFQQFFTLFASQGASQASSQGASQDAKEAAIVVPINGKRKVDEVGPFTRGPSTIGPFTMTPEEYAAILKVVVDQEYALKQRRRDEEREMMQRDGDERTKLFESVVTAVTKDKCQDSTSVTAQGYEEVEATYVHSDCSDEPCDCSEFVGYEKAANSDDDPYSHLI